VGTTQKTTASSVLFVRLEGVLQAWGDSSRWDLRDTRHEPTKAGVLGIVAAAMGWRRDTCGDRRIADLAQRVMLGVRCDRPGRLARDYHTVLGPIPNAKGGMREQSIVSPRLYLADACFLAALIGPADLLDEAEEALRRPHWPPFLGRKSCPPLAPLVPPLPKVPALEEHASLEGALRRFPWLGRAGLGPNDPATHRKTQQRTSQLRCVIELATGEQQTDHPVYARVDDPRSLSGRRFATRWVYEVMVPMPSSEHGSDMEVESA